MTFKFAIIVVQDTVNGVLLDENRFTERQRSALRHIISRAGEDVLRDRPEPPDAGGSEWPGFEPLGQQGATVTSRATPETQAFEDAVFKEPPLVTVPPPVTAAEQRQRAMDANREAAKARAAEQAQQARGMGYTGDLCSQCGSDRMKRNGSCLCCESCGATTGCS